ncbi:MAG: hypothetical protein SAK29_00095 [Scytonema sp. PMC 1069.18]|nr:hypothetical protein [Scytonema sp. PMC 1069.18]MEC4879974.1 hypothetical protein [Scytonema sp. PMC 1070.18]
MLFRILDVAFSILVLLGSGFSNEAVFSQIFLNELKTKTIEQQLLRQDLTSHLIEIGFNILNDIELDDLESIINHDFAQGLPSDTEFSVF